MPSAATYHDIGSFHSALSGVQVDAVAAGGGDAAEASGGWHDVQGRGSCTVWAAWKAVLAATETLSLAFNLQDASDASGTGAADFGTAFPATVVATGDTGGSTETGVTRLGDFDLAGCRGFIRTQVTPDLSAGSLDTLRLQLFIVLGDSGVIPVA